MFCNDYSPQKRLTPVEEYKNAIERQGKFGYLFVEYQGCPRGRIGRAAGLTLEEEALLIPPTRCREESFFCAARS